MTQQSFLPSEVDSIAEELSLARSHVIVLENKLLAKLSSQHLVDCASEMYPGKRDYTFGFLRWICIRKWRIAMPDAQIRAAQKKLNRG